MKSQAYKNGLAQAEFRSRPFGLAADKVADSWLRHSEERCGPCLGQAALGRARLLTLQGMANEEGVERRLAALERIDGSSKRERRGSA